MIACLELLQGETVWAIALCLFAPSLDYELKTMTPLKTSQSFGLMAQ